MADAMKLVIASTIIEDLRAQHPGIEQIDNERGDVWLPGGSTPQSAGCIIDVCSIAGSVETEVRAMLTPGHTDLMVSPESIDAFLATGDHPAIAASPQAPAREGGTIEQRFPALNVHLIRMAHTGSTGSLTEWGDFFNCLQAALSREEAPADGAGEDINWKAEWEASCSARIADRNAYDKGLFCARRDSQKIIDERDKWIVDLNKEILALRARTSEPAGEAVAWTDQENIDQLKTGRGAAIMWPTCHGPSTPYALYTHPAPASADKLRVDGLYDALTDAWTDFLDANPDGLTSPTDLPDHALVTCDQMIDIVLVALAALEGGEG